MLQKLTVPYPCRDHYHIGELCPVLPVSLPLLDLLLLGRSRPHGPLRLIVQDTAPLLPDGLPTSLLLRRPVLEGLESHVFGFGEYLEKVRVIRKLVNAE